MSDAPLPEHLRRELPRNVPAELCPSWLVALRGATSTLDIVVATIAVTLAVVLVAPPVAIVALLVSARIALLVVSTIELRGGRAVRDRYWAAVDRLGPVEASCVRTMLAHLDRSIEFARSVHYSERLERELLRAMRLVIEAVASLEPGAATAQLRQAADLVQHLRGIAFRDAIASTDVTRREIAATIEELQLATAALHGARRELGAATAERQEEAA
jgi:hypothetical protein